MTHVTSTDRAQRRERWVVIGGVLMVALAVLGTYVIAPAAAQWGTRERQIDRARAQVAQLRALQLNGAAFDSAATTAETALAGAGRRVIHARSDALGASALQTLLQGAADASALLVNRVDVAPALDTDGALTATMSAYGDIYGLSALLTQLAVAPRVTMVERLTVQINPALRGARDVLQITVAVRAPMVFE